MKRSTGRWPVMILAAGLMVAPAAAQTPPTQPPATQPPATQPPATDPAPQQTPATQAGPEAARRHLTEARNSLSALTQLPAAGQLAGEARTQVSQLITNFNELITTQENWREAYAKVSANMLTLIGPEETTTTPTPPATAGAVGTSGTAAGMATLDPTVREKLVEMRRHLKEFEKAASGGAAPSATPAQEPQPTTPTTPPTTPPSTPPATPPSTPPATPPSTAASTPPQPTATTGTTETPQATPAADVMKHINAIELMLRSADESGGLTLDKAKVETLRTHIAELRKLLERK